MVESFRLGIGQLTPTFGEEDEQERTDRDLSFGLVAIGVTGVLLGA